MTAGPPEGQQESAQAEEQKGDRYELSGDFRGAVINIKSTIVGSAEIVKLEDLPPEPGDPPFKGLQFFDEADAEWFFGRERLTAHVIGRMHRSRFLAIIGASGSGKSSLVRAGVIPALKGASRLDDGSLPPAGSGNWAHLLLTPGARPMEALAGILSKENDSLSAITALASELESGPSLFPQAIRRYLTTKSKPHLLLVVDQFEEVFTLCKRPEERAAFVSNLISAAESDEDLPLNILLVMRADYYAQVAQQDLLREAVSQHQEFIGAMSRDELVRSIDQPLAKGNWQIQEGLIEVILDDVGYEPGALPLLSHALLETWKRRRGRTLTLSGYREAGGIRGAIAQTAESVFQRQLTPEQQAIARMIFLRLTEVGEDASDTRRRATFDELVTRASDPVTIDLVIKILSDARLVITDTIRPGDVKVVEVAHEAIIREWPTLRDWLAEDREGLILHQSFAEDSDEWLRLEKDPDLLYRGARLERASEWSNANPNAINLVEQEFLQESQKYALMEAERARRLARATRVQRISIAVVVLLIAAIAFLAYTNFFVREPAVMDGLYNIAVADIQVSPELEALDSRPEESADQLTEAVFNSLQTTLGENPNILIWHDGPELEGKNVLVGSVDPTGPESETAEAKAERLHADMVVFGTVDPSAESPVLSLKYYLSPQGDYSYDDIQGTFQSETIPLDNTHLADFTSLGDTEVGIQVSSLAWVALGLSEAQLGRSLEALEAFLEASQASPSSETLQFFIGREYLFLVDREAVLEIAREAFEEKAELAFQEAIRLNPDYERAYVGLAGVHFGRSRNLLAEAVSNPAEAPDLLEAAIEQNSLAIPAYQDAIELAAAQDQTELPLEAIARLGLGNAFRLQGDILTQQGDYPAAEEYVDQAISTLEVLPSSLEDPKNIRYLTQAYEYLGGATESRGIFLELRQDYDASIAAYQTAVEFYDRCIQMMDLTQDVIVRREIIEQVCIPRRQEVQKVLDSYSGGQG